MTNFHLFLRGWTWNPIVLFAIGLTGIAYALAIGRRGQFGFFVAALLLLALALLSPLNLLATGVLFSAHMTQHILLLLFVPGLVLLSLPDDFTVRLPRLHASSDARDPREANRPRSLRLIACLGWALGVGSMWFWHVPQLCDAAATAPPVHAIQTLSLLTMGGVFWWPILAPRTDDRLLPGHGIIYLFTACLACTALGVLLTLTPIEVCPAFTRPSSAPAIWANLRDQIGVRRDQQIGGLLMWLPMCLVYVAAIVLELGRWLGGERASTAPHRT